jgi:hypothetical protein
MTTQTSLKILQDLHLLRVVDRKKGQRMSCQWKLTGKIVRLMEPLGLYTEEERWLEQGQTKRINMEAQWRAGLRERGKREKKKAVATVKTKRGKISKKRIVSVH